MSDSIVSAENASEVVESKGTKKSDVWEEFGERISKEFKSIRWTAKMTDVVSKIANVLNIHLPDTIINSWNKIEEIKIALRESLDSPGEIYCIELAEHSIDAEYHPFVEIKINRIPLPKKIEFDLKLVLNLKGGILEIQDGEIKRIKTGSCLVDGKLNYEDLVLAEKKFEFIELPGYINLIEELKQN